MITPQRISSSASQHTDVNSNAANEGGGASTGRRVVRSVLETLATNATPQPRKGVSAEEVLASGKENASQRKPFTEVSTRTNRSRFADAVDGMSALEFLSPPKVQPQPPRRATSVPQQRSTDKQQQNAANNAGSPHPVPNTSTAKPTPLQQKEKEKKRDSDEEGGVLYTREQVNELLKSTLETYVTQRDEEEEKVLSQATTEIDALQRMVETLEEENKILIGQLDGLSKAKGEADAAANGKHAEEIANYKKAIGLLKRQCTDLTNATTDLHASHAEVKRQAGELQAELVRTVEASTMSSALHRQEVEAMRRSFEELEARHASEVGLLSAQLEEQKRNNADLALQNERLKTELSSAQEVSVVSRSELEGLRRQLSLQKSKCINAGHQRTAVESAKKEEVRDLSARVAQLEEACRNQTDDLRKKLHKITSLEAQRDEARKQLDDANAEMQRFADKMSLVSQTVVQIVCAAEQLDGVLERYTTAASSSASTTAASSSSAPNPTKRRLFTGHAKRATSSNSRSKSAGANDDGNMTFYQRVLSTVSDVIQRLQPIQYVLRDAAGEVTVALDERSTRVLKAEDAGQQLVAVRGEGEKARRRAEEMTKALNEANTRLAMAEQRLAGALCESQSRMAMLTESNDRLVVVTRERDEAAAELQQLRKARAEEKATLATQLEAARATRAEADIALEAAKSHLESVGSAVSERDSLQARVAALEKELEGLTAAHEKLQRIHKRSAEERKGLDEAAAVSEREVNILHNKVRTLESTNAGLRKKIATKTAAAANAAANAVGDNVEGGGLNTNTTKRIASSSASHAAALREIEALRKELASAQAKEREVAAAEEGVQRLVSHTHASCAQEVEFLESVVHAVRRFVNETVVPYRNAVEACAVECSKDSSAASNGPLSLAGGGDYFAGSSPHFHQHQQSSRGAMEGSPRIVFVDQQQHGPYASAASPSYHHDHHHGSPASTASHNATMLVNLSPSYTTTTTTTAMLNGDGTRTAAASPSGTVLFASPPPLFSGAGSGAPNLTPSRALLASPIAPTAATAVDMPARRARVRQALQDLMSGCAATLLLTTASSSSSTSPSSPPLSVIRRAVQQLKASLLFAEAEAEAARQQLQQQLAVAQQQQHQSAGGVAVGAVVASSPLPANPFANHQHQQMSAKWLQATSMLKQHHNGLGSKGTNSSGSVGRAPSSVSPSSADGHGLSTSPPLAMDGNHTSPRRPPMLRSNSAGARVGPGGAARGGGPSFSKMESGGSAHAGPALQLPASANVMVR